MGRVKFAIVAVLGGAMLALAGPAEAQSCKQQDKVLAQQLRSVAAQLNRARGNKAAFCRLTRRALALQSQAARLAASPAGRACYSRASARRIAATAAKSRADARRVCG